jgi:tRNA A37 threonylcarbamoyladenosine dehydratase
VLQALIIDHCCRNDISVMTVGGSGGVTSPEGIQVSAASASASVPQTLNPNPLQENNTPCFSSAQ